MWHLPTHLCTHWGLRFPSPDTPEQQRWFWPLVLGAFHMTNGIILSVLLSSGTDVVPPSAAFDACRPYITCNPLHFIAKMFVGVCQGQGKEGFSTQTSPYEGLICLCFKPQALCPRDKMLNSKHINYVHVSDFSCQKCYWRSHLGLHSQQQRWQYKVLPHKFDGLPTCFLLHCSYSWS